MLHRMAACSTANVLYKGPCGCSFSPSMNTRCGTDQYLVVNILCPRKSKSKEKYIHIMHDIRMRKNDFNSFLHLTTAVVKKNLSAFVGY